MNDLAGSKRAEVLMLPPQGPKAQVYAQIKISSSSEAMMLFSPKDSMIEFWRLESRIYLWRYLILLKNYLEMESHNF